MRKAVSAVWFVVVLGAFTTAGAQIVSPKVTVIGCVERSRPPIPTGGDTTIVDAAQTKYLLTKITLAQHPGTPTDRSESLITETVNVYRLDDSKDGVLAPHVGDRVAITGTVQAPRLGTVGTAGERDRHEPLLNVQEVRTISVDAPECMTAPLDQR